MPQRITKPCLLLLCPVLLAVFAGCGQKGDGVNRVVLSGSVSFKGEPVVKGRIRLTPDHGPVCLVNIQDGTYHYDHRGGVPVARHRVEIWSYDPNQEEQFGPGAPSPRQFLPSEYNKETTLEFVAESNSDGMIQNFELQ